MAHPELIKPGVAILVPAQADPIRPTRPYRLRVRAVYPYPPGERWRICGRIEQLDGTPSNRRYPDRDADLYPNEIEVIKETPTNDR